MLNSVFITKLIECLALRLKTIVMDDPSGDTKSVDDIVFDEVNNIICFNFSERYSFCSLWKVISYRKDELINLWQMEEWLVDWGFSCTQEYRILDLKDK